MKKRNKYYLLYIYRQPGFKISVFNIIACGYILLTQQHSGAFWLFSRTKNTDYILVDSPPANAISCFQQENKNNNIIMNDYEQKKQMLTLLERIGFKFQGSPTFLLIRIEEYIMENPENHNSYDLLNYLARKLKTVKKEIKKSKIDLKEFIEIDTHSSLLSLYKGIVGISFLDGIHVACRYGHINTVKLLLENEKIKFNKSIMNDVDMLLCATFSGKIELIRYLFDYGFNQALQMEYAFVWAAKENYLEIIKFLHEKGVDIHFNDDEAVQVAFEYNNREIVSYLCQHGSKVHLDPNNFDESTIEKLINF